MTTVYAEGAWTGPSDPFAGRATSKPVAEFIKRLKDSYADRTTGDDGRWVGKTMFVVVTPDDEESAMRALKQAATQCDWGYDSTSEPHEGGVRIFFRARTRRTVTRRK